MQIIIGLGNPGATYKYTKHNVGFMLIDRFIKTEINKHSLRKTRYAHFLSCIYNSEEALFMKPHLYMNLSGQALCLAMKEYHFTAEEMLLIQDDIDLPLGVLRFKGSGGAGGHKGVNSIIESLGTNRIKRLKIGIGQDAALPLEEFVLSNFKGEEIKILDSTLTQACLALKDYLTKGIDYAMNIYN